MKQWMGHLFCCGALSLGLSLSSVHAAQTEPAASRRETIKKTDLQSAAMPTTGNDRLGAILQRYYEQGLGGAENWERVMSVRMSGHLILESGQFALNIYQKKPHYIKISLSGNSYRIEKAYDGHSAWQASGQHASVISKMETAAARRFIHRAHFGSYLLYPYSSGKQIEYLNTVPMNGAVCHHIRVKLQTDYQVDYFLDAHRYLEVKTVHTDLRSGAVHSIRYSDYIRKSGIPIAQKIMRYEEGEWLSTLQIDTIKVNSGVMAWMFKIPE